MNRPRVDLIQNLKRSLETISTDLEGSLLYLDEGAFEALNATVGAGYLLGRILQKV